MKKRTHLISYLSIVGCIGAVAMIAQLSYIRLVASSFYGNELTMCITIGHWLLWTGIGSMTGSYFVNKWKTKPALIYITIAYTATVLLFSYALFTIRKIAGIPTTLVVGIVPIFLYTFLILAIPSFINGLFFPFFVALIRDID